MELEQRVKTLEYEMKIVKNEIQRTLLDIQEQVLIHYYPTLRLEETAVPKTVTDTLEQLRAKSANEAKPGNEPVKPASEPKAASPETPSNPTTIKKVSLDEVHAAQAQLISEPDAANAINIVELVNWATKSSARIGSERVKQVIRAYGKKMVIPSEMKNVLVQVVSLDTSRGPEKVEMDDLLIELAKFDAALGRPANPQSAKALIEEAGIG